MKSRAHMLLEKEYLKLQKDKIWGINAAPLNDGNFFLWEANIQGLKDTMWEGGIFKLYLRFSQLYNSVPPELIFTTIPFHPNVDVTTGKPCIDFLDNADSWNQNYNVSYILLTLQALLVNPVLENAVNDQAAAMCLDNPNLYRQMVINCVLASQRLDANLLPFSRNEASSSSPRESSERHDVKLQNNSRVKKSEITFGDYLSLWKGIATSSRTGKTNLLNDIMKSDSNLQGAHFQISKEELAEEIRSQFKEHNRIMRGTVVEKNQKEGQASDVQRESPTKVMLFTDAQPFFPPFSDVKYETPGVDGFDVDREVDELVNWTKNLSAEHTDL